jgi:hypothetical protein
MQEIRKSGTKHTVDWVNEPVKKWGLPSITLAMILLGFFGSGMILFFLLGVYVIVYLIVYAFLVVRISNWMISENKRGISAPLLDRMEYGIAPKSISQNIDFKQVYEDKGSK